LATFAVANFGPAGEGEQKIFALFSFPRCHGGVETPPFRFTPEGFFSNPLDFELTAER
jgi:hypothetical protein